MSQMQLPTYSEVEKQDAIDVHTLSKIPLHVVGVEKECRLARAFPVDMPFPASFQSAGVSEETWMSFLQDLNAAVRLNQGEMMRIVASNSSWAFVLPAPFLVSKTNKRIFDKKDIAVSRVIAEYNRGSFAQLGYFISLTDTYKGCCGHRRNRDGTRSNYSLCSPWGNYQLELHPLKR